MKQFIAVFLVVLLAVGANLSDSFLAGLGVNPNFLLVALAAFVIAGLVRHQNLGFIIIVCLVTVAANLPEELAHDIGYDPTIMVGVLVGLVLIPFISRHILGWLPPPVHSDEPAR